MLPLLGVPERAVMAIMGWSHTSMAARYQHVTETIRSDVADRVGDLIWTTNETRSETRASNNSGDSADEGAR